MKKKIALLIMLAAGLQFTSNYCYAAELLHANEYAVSSGVQVYSNDVIVTKIRSYNGKKQYRRWNQTKQCWVDPKWIDIS